MLQTIEKKQAPSYYYNDHLLTVEYSFSEHTPPNHWISSNKLWLDILFIHPLHNEAVSIRVAKSTLILCQPKEVIEAVVHREIRQFLQQPQVTEYGSEYQAAAIVTAFN